MEIFIAFLILGVVTAAVTAANRNAKNINNAWADAAARLGLDFQPGGPFRRRAIRGSRGAIRIELNEKSGGNNNTVREWRLAYPSTPFSMTLTLETPGKKLLKAFGAEDFEVGDREFDSRFMVAGSDPAAISGYLDSARRRALLDAADTMTGIKVTNSDITWRTTNQYKSSPALLDDAKLLLQTAVAMSPAIEPPPSPVRQPLPPARLSSPPMRPDSSATPAQPASVPDVPDAIEDAQPEDDPWRASHDLPDAEATEPELNEVELSEPIAAHDLRGDVQSESPPSSSELVRLEDLIEDVFSTRRLSFEANQIVAKKFAGRTLMVLGPVRTSRKQSRDFDFPDQGPGIRIEAIVGEVTGTRAGAGDVVAIAYLEGAVEAPKRGDEVLITGTILKVEALRRAVYLVDAQLG